MTPLSPAALEEAAKAVDAAEFGYHLQLTSLVDGVSTYTLTYNDLPEPLTFSDIDDAYLHLADRKRTTQATAAITAYLAQREKEGFVMVPKEPTKEMIYDGNTTIDDCIDFWNYDSGSGYCVEPHAAAACYRTMLSVASQEQNDD